MNILLNLLISTLAVVATAYLLPGVHLENFMSAFVAALVLGVFNSFVKPILIILTLPINILTLGLFTFVIMGLLVLLSSSIVPGFRVDNFGWALLFALVLSLVNGFLHRLAK